MSKVIFTPPSDFDNNLLPIHTTAFIGESAERVSNLLAAHEELSDKRIIGIPGIMGFSNNFLHLNCLGPGQFILNLSLGAITDIEPLSPSIELHNRERAGQFPFTKNFGIAPDRMPRNLAELFGIITNTHSSVLPMPKIRIYLISCQSIIDPRYNNYIESLSSNLNEIIQIDKCINDNAVRQYLTEKGELCRIYNERLRIFLDWKERDDAARAAAAHGGRKFSRTRRRHMKRSKTSKNMKKP